MSQDPIYSGPGPRNERDKAMDDNLRRMRRELAKADPCPTFELMPIIAIFEPSPRFKWVVFRLTELSVEAWGYESGGFLVAAGAVYKSNPAGEPEIVNPRELEALWT